MSGEKARPASAWEICDKAWQMRFSDRQSAMESAESVLNSEGDPHDFAAASVLAALIKFWNGDSESESLVAQALEVLDNEDESTWQVRALCVRAAMDDQLGRYDRGMDLCMRAVDIADKNNWATDAADARNILAQLNMRTERYPEATQCMEAVLEARRSAGDIPGTGSALNMLGRIAVLKKTYTEAEEYYLAAKAHREQNEDKRGLCWTMLGLATLYEQSGRKQEAKDHFNTGIELNKDFDDKVYDLLCKLGISRLLIDDGNAEEAIAVLTTCLEMAEKLRSKPLQADVMEVMHRAYDISGDKGEAYRWLKRYMETREEVMNTSTLNRISAMENAHKIESARHEAEIHRLKNVELRAAMEQIENQRLQLEERNRNITDSIKYAALLQSSVMPAPRKLKQLLPDSFLIFEPRDIVSGDFYYFSQQNGFIYAAVADCTGHGVPGAMVSMVAANALSKAIEYNAITEPGDILNAVRDTITGSFRFSEKQVRDGMDVALCRIPSDRHNSFELSFAGANNPLWVILPIDALPDGDYKVLHDEDEKWAVVEVPADRQAVGYSDDSHPFTTRTFRARSGTCIYLFSDGFADQFGGSKGKKFKSKSLKKLLLTLHEMPMETQKEKILQIFETWRGGYEQIDDVCLSGIRL